MKFFQRFQRKRSRKVLSPEIQSRIDLITKKHDKANGEILTVSIHREKNELFATDGENTFYFDSSMPINENFNSGEFALWSFLPVAMAKGMDLHIDAPCSSIAIKNAEKLVEAWACWLPGVYSLIRVSSSTIRDQLQKVERKDLICFSGGVDSTYTLLKKDFSGGVDFITVQGMDYYISDDDSFEKAKLKTAPMAKLHASERLFIRSNAYSIYKNYNLAPRITYVFVLSACAFIHLHRYSNVTMAADFALYQQLEELPYGASFATDRFFSSGDFSLQTHAEDVTRAEKLPVITNVQDALLSLSFCKDRSVRPDNCGICIKCMRTKYMFLAALGRIPEECFIDPKLDNSEKVYLSKVESKQEAYIKSTYAAAFWNNNLDKVPMIVDAYLKIKKAKK